MQTIAHNHLKCASLCNFPLLPCDRIAYGPQKTGARRPRLSSWLCARIKIERLRGPPDTQLRLRFARQKPVAGYALRRGRTVKSRTCARMLDICIPFSCDRYGKTSATN
jgi:hypothetical protein